MPCPYPVRADEAHVEQTDGQVEKSERALELMGAKRGY